MVGFDVVDSMNRGGRRGCGVADTLGTKYTHSCVIGARLHGMTWVPSVACKTATSREECL